MEKTAGKSERILVFSMEQSRFQSLGMNRLHTPPAEAGTPNGVRCGNLQKTQMRPAARKLQTSNSRENANSPQ